ncbi:hypothetical protein [Chroococcidiopsis sp. CCNUC1]|uniref:hypothetical protein n=1 Tax=Chroococcidiopsis sp. CCNUC1 TaxID=2653189 RepID=UPI0020222E31|nr:hypothetical protein [Chroococcidiopsis sp. CCNUC1]URD52288.1 hypothetical protein M5J74_09895 [Chroococcidiopsis sp. CCNUC1]
MKSQIYSLLLVVSAAVAIAPSVCATEAEISIPQPPLKKGAIYSPQPPKHSKEQFTLPNPPFEGGAAGGGSGDLWHKAALSKLPMYNCNKQIKDWQLF